MEFYKLFCHRTNWVELWIWERKLIMPEYYEKLEKEHRERLAKLLTPFAIIENCLGHRFYN